MSRRIKKKDFYPTDPTTQMNANLLYRAVKDAVKRNGASSASIQPLLNSTDEDLAGEILEAYLAEKAKRGFSSGYLTELAGTIEGALSKAVPVDTSAAAAAAYSGDL